MTAQFLQFSEGRERLDNRHASGGDGAHWNEKQCIKPAVVLSVDEKLRRGIVSDSFIGGEGFARCGARFYYPAIIVVR
tara:strand:+ start:161 stop:394 length:234 start_codon:yes stop_codon:yes gene_type:complete